MREIGGPQNEAVLHHNIGSVHRYKGSCTEALAACRRALAIYRDIGDLPHEAEVLNDIGAIYQSASCYDEALVHHQRARLIAEDIGNVSQQLIALRLIADISRGSGRYSEALEHYHAALRLSREIGEPFEEGKILEGIAEAMLDTQRFDAGRPPLSPGLARILSTSALERYANGRLSGQFLATEVSPCTVSSLRPTILGSFLSHSASVFGFDVAETSCGVATEAAAGVSA